MAIALSGRAPGTLPSNTEVNPKEHVKAITTRSGVQLPEIHVKRSVANKEMVPSTDEEHVEQNEQTTTMKESINLMPLSIFRKLADFIILDMEEDKDVPLFLGRPFLATSRALIDVQKGQLILRLSEEQVTFDVFKAIKYPTESDSCFKVDVVDDAVHENFHLHNPLDPLEACIVHS
ncbi:Uncharacterized protein Adt_03499 [Abeliophyllum distichum]|uniref:Reverse transcriptase domain-containing protein n=1 Tax=Abeliophyllum distichum TaxID=126358 RepID=A0ABD1VYN9_9LAMI